MTNCSVNYRELKGQLLFIIIRVLTEHACDLTAVMLKRKVVSTIQSYIDSVLNLEAVSRHFAPWDVVCDMRNKQFGCTCGRYAVVFI